MSDVIRLNKKTCECLEECLIGFRSLYENDNAILSHIENLDDNEFIQLVCEFAKNYIYDLTKLKN